MNPAISAIVRPLLSLIRVPAVAAALFFVTVALAFAAPPESGPQRREGKGGASVVNPAWRAPQTVEKSGGKVKKPPYAAGELLIKFKAGVPEEKKSRLHGKNGGKKVREFKRLRLHHVKLKQGDAVEEAMARYQADPDVEYAEPNYQLFSSAAPNDPSYSLLWGMAKINAPQAWDVTTGSQEVVVAVIDTGIDYTHPDLAGNIWVNPGEMAGNGSDDDNNGFVDDLHGINAISTVTPGSPGDPMDDNGHGTHVSGTIGAVGNNGVGVAGVNWSVKIMGCKFLDSTGGGYSADAIACLDYVKAQKDAGVNVVATSNSWGGGGNSKALYDAIKAQSDILFIAAAGNSSGNNDSVADYPSSYELPNIISVAASTSSDGVSSYSNYGKYTVDVAAPGDNIFSTLPANNDFGISGGYGNLSGTSMATPHVTGLAALLKAQDPNRDWSKIRNLIFTGGRDVTAFATKTRTGKIIDAAGSLSCQNRPFFSVDWLPSTLTLGHPYTISAMSINCDAPAGPVTVTGDGVSLVLADPGGTGNFSGSWTPDHLPITLTVSSPAGSQTLSFSSLKVIPYIPGARVEIPYSRQLQAAGGLPPYQWSVKSGTQPDGKVSTLPSGLSWTTGGVISGTLPNSASNNTSGTGNSNTAQALFMVEVTDSRGDKASSWVSLDIDGQGWLDQSFGEFYDAGDDDKAWGVATDAAGNSYVTGHSYNGSDLDLILLKYDATGTLLWKRSYDKGGDEIGRSLALDQAGDLYVAGVAGTPGNHLLVKYDASGNLIWDRVWNGGGDDGAFGVAADSTGAVYTVGNVQTGEGDQVLISKYDAGGNAVWSRVHPEQAYGYSIAADNGGNVYFAGALLADGVKEMLLAKYDAQGNSLWSRTVKDTPTAVSAFNGVAVDGSGNPYVTGWVDPAQFFVDYSLTAKYDAAGNQLWISRLQGSDGLNDNFGNNYPYGIAISNDKIYLAVHDYTLSSSANVMVVRYDTLGKKIWSKRLDVYGTGDYSNAVAADGGGVTVTGYSGSSSALNGGSDILTARFAEAAPRYDLTVTDLSTSYNGISLSYTVKTKNIGLGSPTANVVLRFSTDATPSSNDYTAKLIKYISHPAGVEVSQTGSFTIPSGLVSGSYYVTATVDHTKALNEVSKSNNSMVGARYDLRSELAVTAAWGTLTKQGTGGIDYTVKVKNTGYVTSAPSSTALYLSTDPLATTADYPLGLLQTAAVVAGAEITLTGTAAVPATIPPGTYYLAAVADAGGAVMETSETNNALVGSLVTLPTDLTVSALSGSVSQGTLSYSVTLGNNGWQTVAPSLALYLSPDAYASPDDRLIVSLQPGSIAGGGQATLSGQAALPPDLPGGTYYLVAMADPDSYIAETDETNNGASGGRLTIGSAGAAIVYSRLGSGSGTVTFGPGGECRGDCSQGYDPGTTVTLTAAPANGSLFTGWGGACSGTGTCTVTMDAGKQVTATFDKKPSVSYTIAGTGTGTVGFYPGTSCAGSCAQSFDSGSTIYLVATPSVTSRFAGWGGACSGTGACQLTMTGDKSVSATFENLAPKITAGYEQTLLLTGNTVWGWGYDLHGELGAGANVQARRTPVQAWSSQGIASIVVGVSGYTGMALKQDGSVLSWGSNSSGEVGDGTTVNRNSPVSVPALSQIVSLKAGDGFAMALRGDGTVWTWGNNKYGQLGSGSGYNAPPRSTPTQNTFLTGVTAIGTTWETAFALKGDGTLWGWGYNYDGEIGDGTVTLQTAPVQVQGISGVTSITGGWYHTLALKSDGTVWAWGGNDYGELGDGTAVPHETPVQVPGLSGVVAIAAGGFTSYALKDDGTIWVWGDNTWGVFGNGDWDQGLHASPIQIPGLTGVVAIAAGDFHIAAVKGDGTVWAWGDNSDGQIGDGTDIERDAPVQVFLDVSAPVTTVSPSQGTFDTAQLVTLTPDKPATVYYTLNGSTPTSTSAVYTGPLSISSTTTVKFFAKDAAGNVEAVRTASYVIAPSSVPNVEFNANTVWGQPPLAVTFSDLSTGSPVSWLWNFGDGATSTERNPVHSYASYGSYTVTLTVTGAGGTASRTKTGFINVASTTNVGVTPSSTATPAGGTYSAAQNVVLSRNLSSTIYYTLDGSQPTTSSAVYYSAIAISSTTTLKYFARDSAGRTEAVNTQVYRIVPAGTPQADFAASTTSGSAPLSVSFSDLSTGSPTSWLWSFGDGSTSTLRNPTHLYRTPGSYTVSLTVTGAGGSDTRQKTSYVVAAEPGPDSLQPLYNSAADGSSLFMRSGDLTEDLTFDRDISVKIFGGYDYLYQNVVGVTKLHGLIRLKNGKVTLENMAIR